MSRRTPSSQRWRQRQERDVYVDRAQREGWRSRAVFKLQEINATEKLLATGMTCVDLGAAPGGWSQLAARLVGESGHVIAVDVLPMEPIAGVEFILGNFADEATVAEVHRVVGERRVGLVMSDMAPNISGNRAIDQARSLALLEAALSFAADVLAERGALLLKAFQGEGVDEFTRELRNRFTKVRVIKPKASRAESREIYLLARNYGL
jgi:23S rRNA (uridine2552-2'-O)-methyltransferase